MNRDLWCADITGNGSDEILAANADGTLYCLDANGDLLWKFRPSDAPMSAVTVVHHEGSPYVVCGGYDKNIYYLTAQGELVKTIASSTYSKEKPWGKEEKRIPPKFQHIANFIRTVRGPDGQEAIAVHATLYSNSSTGSIYLFKPMADQPFHIISKVEGTAGDMQVTDLDQDGISELLCGASSMIQDAAIVRLDLKDDQTRVLKPSAFRKEIDGFGYRVAQTVPFGKPGKEQLFTSFGSRIIISTPELDVKSAEVIEVGYSFNDLCKDPRTGNIILAGTQTGGSCVHVVDTTAAGWKEALATFEPKGKLKAVIDNMAGAREQLKSFTRPAWEHSSRTVYFLSDDRDGSGGPYIAAIEKSGVSSPVFLNYTFDSKAENWDRSGMQNEHYKTRRDRRKKYTATQQECLDRFLPAYDGMPGQAFWGGHGNDPYMYSLDTKKKVLDAAGGKKTVMIFPELEHYDDDFAFVLNDHIYPLAEAMQGRNANLYVRTKHAFWQSIIYMPLWSRLLSGEFADVFVPSMEETTDKTMEQSVAGRVGIWAGGAVNQWGSRGARDNASFDRLRQHSHQMIPNHFLRAQIYNIACGATYQNNFAVNQETMSILWELIAKGALYVPERDEIVSFSPVHLSMTEPDEFYLDDGNNAKWLTFFDQEFENANPMVFGRLNGTWPGAPVTEWDFSRYAAGVKDRRLHFLPPYSNGLVLITPPQHGVFADQTAPRGKLADHLHPIYKNILKEYITDGRNYLSADGTQTFAANTFFQTLENDIQESAKLLPLTVSGDVAWVCAQTAPNHLRLTLIDSGYIDPADRTATVTFHTAQPAKMTDLLSGDNFALSGMVKVDVPCGLFRFIDIELKEAL
jgi:hypothetical protein